MFLFLCACRLVCACVCVSVRLFACVNIHSGCDVSRAKE